MYLFKTSGETYDSVLLNQKHAFNGRLRVWEPGEIVLVSKNKSDCMPSERQIRYTMRLKDIRNATDDEIESYWPGNAGRWRYIVDCTGTEPVPNPFNLNEVIGEDAREYAPVLTFKKIREDHEALILRHLVVPSQNSTDEISPSPSYQEGSVRSININAYERDPKARQDCLSYFGLSCQACGFNFQDIYGELGMGYIHVHHVVPLSDIGEQYTVNPIRDLVPLCANCHAMIHRRKPTLTVDELRSQIRRAIL